MLSSVVRPMGVVVKSVVRPLWCGVDGVGLASVAWSGDRMTSCVEALVQEDTSSGSRESVYSGSRSDMLVGSLGVTRLGASCDNFWGGEDIGAGGGSVRRHYSSRTAVTGLSGGVMRLMEKQGGVSSGVRFIVTMASPEEAYEQACELIAKRPRTDEDMQSARVLLEQAAEANHPAAMGRLGRWYLFQLLGGLDGKQEAGFNLLYRAADAGDAEAAYWLGHTLYTLPLHEDEPDVGRKEGESREDFEARLASAAGVVAEIKALRKANRRAKRGRPIVKDGETTPTGALGLTEPPPYRRNQELGVTLLKIAGQAGNANAAVMLGNIALDARPPAAETAVEWYKFAAEQNPPHPDALFNLGQVFWEGAGSVSPDHAKAWEFFVQATVTKDPSALFWVGHAYRTGIPTIALEPDKDAAVRNLHEAVDLGHAGAAHYLGQLYRSGDDEIGIPADDNLSQTFFAIAEAANFPDTLFERGVDHYHGTNGADIDLPRALQFFLRAGQGAHADALVSAGAMFFNGHGVEQNYEAAYDMYQKATELHHKGAWENIAEMYDLGIVVEKSPAQAKYIRDVISKWD